MSSTNKKSGTRNKDEQGFNDVQLRQLATLMKYTIQETVPPMIEKIVDEKLEPIKRDISELKQDIKILKREAIKHGWDLSPDEDE